MKKNVNNTDYMLIVFHKILCYLCQRIFIENKIQTNIMKTFYK
jgi:hypothetical protein